MDSAAVLIYFAFLVFYAWLSYAMWHMSVACWKPHQARQPWLNVVNANGGRLRALYKWVSPPIGLMAFIGVPGLALTIAKELSVAS